ncbi:hypothetical protein CIL02_07970 [Prevotella sp. P3-122]|nr:hypothetical protein CIL02_07970 [Prevotella sp. P3-122]
MYLLIHNLKIAIRNLMKYKLQTIISVLGIAIGIVTLAFAHSAIERIKLPTIYHQSYYDRAYQVWFDSLNLAPDADTNYVRVNKDIIRALKGDGGLKCAEKMAVPNGTMYGNRFEFHFSDSSILRKAVDCCIIDPEMFDYHGHRSAITGERIKKLGVGEAIICKSLATIIFGDKNPVGAVQVYTSETFPIPFTIVDVCEDFSEFDSPLSPRHMYISLGDVESVQCETSAEAYAIWINVARKEECTDKQLLDEINSRIKPFGIKAQLQSEAGRESVEAVLTINSLVYLVSSLILIAAIIGFLRMQIQLFWSRRREVSLRIVNGATRWQLFYLFCTEVLITICMSVITAVLIGNWIEHFLYTRLADLMSEGDFVIHNLGMYSCQIGLLLFVICSLTIWIALIRICKSEKGLEANMRHSRTHIFRNTMLGFQIAISIVFVCGTFITLNWADKMLDAYHLPEDESFYENCVSLSLRHDDDPKQLVEEIRRLPDVDRMVCHSEGHIPVLNLTENEEAKVALQRDYLPFFCATDTTLLSFYNLKAHWFAKNNNVKEFVLMNESIYSQLKELGVIDNGTLTLNDWNEGVLTLPIAGTIPDIPYTNMKTSIYIHQGNEGRGFEYVVVPKAGRYASLISDMEKTIHRLSPSVSDKMAKNFCDKKTEINLIRSMKTIAWILGAVSIIICAMSIYSTIALDTRSRRKEVAIRKVHGAMRRDIYRLFGRLYFILIVLALFIAIPGAILFNQMMDGIMQGSVDATLSPVIPCILGSLVIIILIALIVGWHIRKVMKVECDEMIVKE